MAIPADLNLDGKGGIKMVVEAFADRRVNVVDEVLNYDHVLGGALQATRLTCFTLDDTGSIAAVTDVKFDDMPGIASLRKGDKVLLLADNGIYDNADTNKPLTTFDGITGMPVTIVDGDGDTVNVYFYEDGNFKTVTFDMTSGEYVENADTYRTPGVRRTANGTTVWTRPVMNSTDPRGWGYTPAKA